MTASSAVPPINPETPPNSPTPSALPTEAEVLRSQLSNLQGTVNQLASLVQNSIVTNRPAPAPRPAITAEEFANNPQAFLDRLNSDISEQLAPVNQMREQFQRQSVYQSAKNTVKNSNMAYARLWSHIEPGLDQLFANGQMNPDPNIIAYHAQSIVGGLAMTNPGLLAGNPTPPAPTPSNMIPPSGVPAPSSPAPVLRDLDANEQRIAEERGLTKEQYLKLVEGSAMVVSPSSVPRTK